MIEYEMKKFLHRGRQGRQGRPGMYRQMERIGGFMSRYPPQFKRKTQNKKRFVNPQSFSDVYGNPLSDIFPLLQYLLPNQVTVDIQPQQKIKHDDYAYEDRYQRSRDKRYDFADEEYIPMRKNQQIIQIARRFPNQRFIEIKSAIQKNFKDHRDKANRNRKKNLDEIQDKLKVNIKQKKEKIENQTVSNWQRIQKIINEKIFINQSKFSKIKILIEKSQNFIKLIESIRTNKQQLKLKSFKKLNRSEKMEFYQLILHYFTLPSIENLHESIRQLEKGINNIFRGLHQEDEKIYRIIKDLPYKQSSFYWGKILQCCRYISDIDHPNSLSNRKMQPFSAEYGGQISGQTLRKLKQNEWLDNTITSALIQYLKNIEGANNYHNDDNFNVCIFTHSQASIFMNSQRDMSEDYAAYQKFIFLINHDNNHWFVIVAYSKQEQIVVLDSLASGARVHNQYCDKIAARLKRQLKIKKNKDIQFKIESFSSPSQSNTSDCGVFSIVNIIWALDKDYSQIRLNLYQPNIMGEIRLSIYLFLLYLGYCRRFNVVTRKDYFDILFRSTIYSNLRSRLNEEKGKSYK